MQLFLCNKTKRKITMKKILAICSIMVFIACNTEQKDSENKSMDTTSTLSTISHEGNQDTDTLTTYIEMTPDNIWDQSIRVYLNDPEISPTNVRKSPGGEVLMQLSERYGYEVRLIGFNNGWFITNYVENIDLENEITENIKGYIHGSVLAASTRNYGGEEIRVYSSPDEESEIVTTILQETQVRLKSGNEDGNWLEISFNKNGKIQRGWIESKWLCGSIRTNCS